jgi:hypothetical protein
VQHVIREAITDERLDLLERNLEYHLQVADVIERYGYDRGLESNELAVVINSANCGYLEIGAALEALEKEEPGLGAAFYWELTSSRRRAVSRGTVARVGGAGRRGGQGAVRIPGGPKELAGVHSHHTQA